MKRGYLSEYFDGVTAKRISAVEADLLHSNQHEFNGVQELKRILGEPVGKVRYEATFIYMSDIDEEPVIDKGFLTWYDARENHPTRSEYRLYFPSNTVLDCASQEDYLVIAKRTDNSLLAIICEVGSTIEKQIQWLFGFDEKTLGFSVKHELESEQDRLSYASKIILEEIGIEAIEEAPSYLDDMLEKFGGGFPTTKIFSNYARSTMQGVSSLDNPDEALLAWTEREVTLFKTMEKYLIGGRLKAGFDPDDVDSFLAFSLSVQNRRKSRAGNALENHMEEVFVEYEITYSRTPCTEGRRKPDFILPDIEKYHDKIFPADRLIMLGAKTTCKDRWRQVLNEASRIERKHLLTLQPSISEAQTDEMEEEGVQLVIPEPLKETYNQVQQSWLWNVSDFLSFTKKKQRGL